MNARIRPIGAPVADTPSATPAELPASAFPRRSWRERLRLPLMIGVPLLVAAGVAAWWVAGSRYVSTDDAYLRAAQVTVSTNVSGRVAAVRVGENARVRRGQVLFQLDEQPFRIAVEQARAHLAGARLEVEALKATYRQRLADARAAEAAAGYQRRESERQQKLFARGIASQSQADRAQLARNEASQQLAAARQQITAALANLNGDPDLMVGKHPSVLAAQAELERAELNLSYATVRASIDGIVTRVAQLQPGDYINAAAPAFALVSDSDEWVEANFKEDQLAHMRVGQSATVHIDALPDQHFRAHVTSVSPGTGSEFSLLPAENATGNWVKVVQRLPVRLEFEGAKPPARSGLSAYVTVDIRG